MQAQQPSFYLVIKARTPPAPRVHSVFNRRRRRHGSRARWPLRVQGGALALPCLPGMVVYAGWHHSHARDTITPSIPSREAGSFFGRDWMLRWRP